MENQMFLDFGLRFNLRQTKENKPTIIYAVFVWEGVQYKINTSLKVYPSHWDNKTQTATVSNRLSKLDNHNNRIANRKISAIISSFSEKKHYLSNRIELDIVNEIATTINPNRKNKSMKVNKIGITDVLEKMAEKRPIRSIDQYLFTVKGFKKYLDVVGVDNNISKLDGELLNAYQDYLVKGGKQIKTISAYLRNLKTLINAANKDKELNVKIDISELDIIKDKRTNEQKKSKQIPLTENQLMDIYHLKDLTEKEEEARDLFICQSLLGQRISDMPKIFKGDYITNVYKDGLETISFNVQKTGEEATLFLFPIAKDIIIKYRNKQFKYYNLFETDERRIKNIERTVNTDIKEVCKKAGLTSEVNFTIQKGDKLINERKQLYELMHTHIARHTFITLMCKMGIPKDIVMIATAHTDEKMINEVYLHETANEKGRKFVEALQANKKQSILFAVPNNNYSNTDLLNKLFAYDILMHLENLMKNNIDAFHTDSTKKAIKIIKDLSTLSNYPKDIEKEKVLTLDRIVFEISYYFRDAQLYSTYQYKKHYFGIIDRVSSYDEVNLMFANEDIERPKQILDAQIEEYENR